MTVEIIKLSEYLASVDFCVWKCSYRKKFLKVSFEVKLNSDIREYTLT